MIRVFFAAFIFSIVFVSTLAFAQSKSFDVKIDGMTCANCAKMVSAALSKIPGVDAKTVRVTLKKKDATFIATTNDKTFNDQIKAAIESAGYKVTMINGDKSAASSAQTN